MDESHDQSAEWAFRDLKQREFWLPGDHKGELEVNGLPFCVFSSQRVKPQTSKMSSTVRGVKQISTKKGKCRLPVQYHPSHPGSQVPSVTSGNSALLLLKVPFIRNLSDQEGVAKKSVSYQLVQFVWFGLICPRAVSVGTVSKLR